MAAALLIPSTALIERATGISLVRSAFAACTKYLAWDDVFPQTAAKGARAFWKIRTLWATDWAVGGFAAQVMWVGTNYKNANERWVEVGVTHGWQGQNIKTYYTARGNFTVNPVQYTEWRWVTPAVSSNGSTVKFTVKSTNTGGLGVYTAYIEGNGHDWGSHTVNTVNYSMGLEATCHNSQVDRTWVSQQQYLERPTDVYIVPNNGVLVEAPFGPPPRIAWCNNPSTFRYFLNSAIATNTCT